MTRFLAAAALVPGDVVRGPEDWFTVDRVETLTDSGKVRIYPCELPGLAYEQCWDYPVEVRS